MSRPWRCWMCGSPYYHEDRDCPDRKRAREQAGPSPFEKGKAAGLAGKPSPEFPMPDSSWETRLYAAGWSRGIDERLAAQAAEAAKPHKHDCRCHECNEAWHQRNGYRA